MSFVVVPTIYDSLSRNVNNFDENYSILPTWFTFSSSKPSNEIADNLGNDRIEIKKTFKVLCVFIFSLKTVIQTEVSIEVDKILTRVQK